jgi:hypothetical protein
MGHGAFDSAAGEGTLLLKGDDGKVRPVSGRLLADHLGDLDLLLVVLNACNSAELSGAHPFGGVASALVRAGMPAVVAMQFPVSDEAAIAFSNRFYTRLAAGDPVDLAVAEGRLGISNKLPGSFEWATPALYLRVPDGVLFVPDATPRAAGNRLLLALSVSFHAYSLLSQKALAVPRWKIWIAAVLAAFLLVALWLALRAEPPSPIV